MSDLILRPSPLRPSRPWALQLRDSGPAETAYSTIVRVSDATARAILDAGAAILWGDLETEGGDSLIVSRSTLVEAIAAMKLLLERPPHNPRRAVVTEHPLTGTRGAWTPCEMAEGRVAAIVTQFEALTNA